MTVATDKGSTVALLTENGEETHHHRPTLHYVVPDPGNFCPFAVSNRNATGVPDAFLRTFFAETLIILIRSAVLVGMRRVGAPIKVVVGIALLQGDGRGRRSRGGTVEATEQMLRATVGES